MSLTEAGERYYREVADILRALEEADARAAGEAADPTGTLRVTAPLSFGISRMGPVLSEFMERHPYLRVLLRGKRGQRCRYGLIGALQF